MGKDNNATIRRSSRGVQKMVHTKGDQIRKGNRMLQPREEELAMNQTKESGSMGMSGKT